MSSIEQKNKQIIEALKKDPSLFDEFKANPEKALGKTGIKMTQEEIKAFREGAKNITSQKELMRQLQDRSSNKGSGVGPGI